MLLLDFIHGNLMGCQKKVVKIQLNQQRSKFALAAGKFRGI